jgi:hypothetical protein
MQEFDYTKYITIITASVTVFVLIILIFLPRDMYKNLVDGIFQGFIKERPGDDKDIPENSFWRRLAYNLRVRLFTIPIFFLLTVILMLVFIDGCILKTEYIYPDDICPSTQSHCFARYLNKSKGLYPCTENEIVISNVTNIKTIVCYTWIARKQNSVDIFNQLGLCTGILALLALYFKLLHWMTRSQCLMCIMLFLSVAIIAIVAASIFDDLKLDLHLSVADKWLIALIALIHGFIWLWMLCGHLQENKIHNGESSS